mgnify:FL=1
MKKSNLLLNLLLAFVLIGGMTACNDDEPGLEEKEGIDVAPGFYMAMEGQDPVAGAVLTAANVDGPSIGALERSGFVQGYMYLTAGNYNIVEVEDKQIAQVLGGAVTTVSGDDANNQECNDNTEYHVVASAQVDGAAFAVPVDGFYVVAYDGFASGTNDIVFDQIVSIGIIGDATPGGWGEDTGMAMTADFSADGFTAEAVDVTLDEAQMKFRFNCRWAVDRRTTTDQDFANDNGYSFWTNFGGTLNGTDVSLIPGNDGGNIQLSEYAEYKVTFSWDAIEGFAATVTRTGDAVPKPDFPEAMYITGSATTYGWAEPATDANAIMHKVGNGNDGLYWKIAHLTAGEGFKLSAAAWGIPNIDCGMVNEFDANGVTVTCSGNDWTIAEDGIYTVVLDLRDDMIKVSIMATKVYGMGEAFPTTPAWEKDNADNLFTLDVAAMTVTSPALRADATIRSYVSHPWITDWWTSEFVPNAGAIEYRNDGSNDPTAIAGTTGQVIVYKFDDNTSTIN